jgi:hypothetical protein
MELNKKLLNLKHIISNRFWLNMKQNIKNSLENNLLVDEHIIKTE